MHTPTTAGISGGRDGAHSIVMSGGYEDDDDKGDTMCATDRPRLLIRFLSPCRRFYTGTGGHGSDNRYGGGSSGSQIEDQSFEHKDNNALRVRSRGSVDSILCLTFL